MNRSNDSSKELEESGKEEREAELLGAMHKLVKILEPLSPSSRRRVVRAVIGFYELKTLEDKT